MGDGPLGVAPPSTYLSHVTSDDLLYLRSPLERYGASLGQTFSPCSVVDGVSYDIYLSPNRGVYPSRSWGFTVDDRRGSLRRTGPLGT